MLRSAATPNRILDANESEMEHKTTRRNRPMLAAPAAEGVAQRGSKKPATTIIQVRLIKD